MQSPKPSNMIGTMVSKTSEFVQWNIHPVIGGKLDSYGTMESNIKKWTNHVVLRLFSLLPHLSTHIHLRLSNRLEKSPTSGVEQRTRFPERSGSA